jgi:ABC-type transporter Mla MlaB component
VLRIHIEGEDVTRVVTLRLEGRLVQPWVDELFKTWLQLAERLRQGVGIQADLDAVSFVDESGRLLLGAMSRKGCQLRGKGPYIAALLEEILDTGPGRPMGRW